MIAEQVLSPTKPSSKVFSRFLNFLMYELIKNNFFIYYILNTVFLPPSPPRLFLPPYPINSMLPPTLEDRLALLLAFCFKCICTSDEIATYNEIKILISICLKQGHPVSPRSPGKPKQKEIRTHWDLIYVLTVNSVLVFKDASISQFTNTN